MNCALHRRLLHAIRTLSCAYRLTVEPEPLNQGVIIGALRGARTLADRDQDLLADANS